MTEQGNISDGSVQRQDTVVLQQNRAFLHLFGAVCHLIGNQLLQILIAQISIVTFKLRVVPGDDHITGDAQIVIDPAGISICHHSSKHGEYQQNSHHSRETTPQGSFHLIQCPPFFRITEDRRKTAFLLK